LPYLQADGTVDAITFAKPFNLRGTRSCSGGYFSFGTIAGIDIKLPDGFDPGECIHAFERGQADPQFLSRVANEIAPGDLAFDSELGPQ